MGLKNNQQRELATASKLPPMGLGSAVCSWEQERSLSALGLVQGQPSPAYLSSCGYLLYGPISEQVKAPGTFQIHASTWSSGLFAQQPGLSFLEERAGLENYI